MREVRLRAQKRGVRARARKRGVRCEEDDCEGEEEVIGDKRRRLQE